MTLLSPTRWSKKTLEKLPPNFCP